MLAGDRDRLADVLRTGLEDAVGGLADVVFRDPDEEMLLPESIDDLKVYRGGLQSTRRSQTFSDYRRFLTGARLVK